MSLLTKIDRKVQTAVDAYIQTHKQYKELEAELKKLREIIQPYMEENLLEMLLGMNVDGKLTLTTQDRPLVTSRYTYYDILKVLPLLDNRAKQKCTVNLIDKEALEALEKLGEAPTEVLTHRIAFNITKLNTHHKC